MFIAWRSGAVLGCAMILAASLTAAASPAAAGATAAGCPAAPYGPRFYAPGAGKTVIMHNQPIGNPATVSALPAIIWFFRSHGYQFVAL